jgi:hypothetical protein
MISELRPQDILYLKYIRDKVLVKYSLPPDCVSIEFMDDEFYRLIFPMRKFPFEVFMYRYEIIDKLYEELKSLTEVFSTKRLHFMKVYVDYRPKNKNLLYLI